MWHRKFLIVGKAHVAGTRNVVSVIVREIKGRTQENDWVFPNSVTHDGVQDVLAEEGYTEWVAVKTIVEPQICFFTKLLNF